MKEKEICKSFYKQVRLLQQNKYFKKPFFVFHVPNEQKTNMAYTMHLKSIGLVGGVSDYCILKEGGSMFIEFKRNKKCTLTFKQKAFKQICEDLKIPFLVTHTVDDAIEFIKNNL